MLLNWKWKIDMKIEMKPEDRMKLFQLVVAGEQCVGWEQFKRRMHDKKWLASEVREKLIQKKSEVDFLEDVLENIDNS
jgi:hypothetical protein